MNETLMKMVSNLKPNVVNEIENFTFNTTTATTMKRSLSNSTSSLDTSPTTSTTNCFDQHGPVNKKYKQQRNKMDLTYMGSPREVRRLRADQVEARNTILNLQQQIEHMHNIQKEMRLMFDNETKSLKRQYDYDRKTIEDLENQLQIVRHREMDVKQQLAEMTNNYNMLKIRKDEEIEELEKSIIEFKDESKLVDNEENTEISKLNRKINELQLLLNAAEENAEAQKKLATDLKNELIEQRNLNRDSDMKEQALICAKLKIKDLQYAKENYLEYQELVKAHTSKLLHYTEIEKENERLKDENCRLKDHVRNKLILEEEVNDLKSRLINYKEQEKKCAQLEAQHVQIELHLNEWRAVARGICETTTTITTTESDLTLPHLLRSIVEKLQQSELQLTSTKVELESQLKTLTYEAKMAQTELEKSQKLMNDLKKTGDQKQGLIHRLQKKLLLISRERDSYRLQLDSYEKDLTITLNPNNATTGMTNINVNNNNNNNQLKQAQKERIENLEKILDGYRELNAKLENDLQNANPTLYEDTTIPIKAEQMQRFQQENQQLKLENERLKERQDELEIQLENHLVGYDTLHGGEQVYHLTNNPLAICIQYREQQLEQEIERLKRKIKTLEDGLEASKLNETKQDDMNLLKEQMKKNEQQMERLKDCFKSSMQEFRNVIYMLLGYKVDRTSNSLYKLTSIYADRPEDQLCFQLNNEGALNLLENDFSSTLEDLVNLHLKHQKSIPVFLSAITMDLFNNRTMTTTRTFEID